MEMEQTELEKHEAEDLLKKHWKNGSAGKDNYFDMSVKAVKEAFELGVSSQLGEVLKENEIDIIELKDITDEDAIEVARIRYKSSIEPITEQIIVLGKNLIIQMFIEEDILFEAKDVLKVANYLQSKGYKLPITLSLPKSKPLNTELKFSNRIKMVIELWKDESNEMDGLHTLQCLQKECEEFESEMTSLPESKNVPSEWNWDDEGASSIEAKAIIKKADERLKYANIRIQELEGKLKEAKEEMKFHAVKLLSFYIINPS